MRVIKLAFISFVVLFLLVTVMSLAIPSHIRISKATNVLAQRDSLLSLLTNPAQWQQWHPVFQQEGAQQLLQQHKIAITPLLANDTLVQMQWQQDKRTPVINSWQIHQFHGTDSVTVQWYMDFKLAWYPWQKFSSLMYEKTYGVMMEKGLSNLKAAVEAKKP